MNIPILVVSCDLYKDVWPAFFQSFFKYWSDCPFPIYLVSNNSSYSDSRVLPLLVGDDVDYSSNLIKAVQSIQEEWLIFWIDDRPPATSVDTAQLVRLIELAQEKDAGYLKLIPCHPFALVSEKEEIGEIPKNSRYLVSMTVALWKKSTLLKVLEAGESAWDIEKKGGVKRARNLNDKFYALPIKSLNPYPIIDIHMIAKGKLRWQGIKFLRQQGLLHHLYNRSRVTSQQYVYDILFNLVLSVNSHFRFKLLQLVNKFTKA